MSLFACAVNLVQKARGERGTDADAIDVSAPDFRTFEEFWPFYVGEHSEPATRWLHFIGTTAGFGCAAAFVATGNPLWLPAGLVCGYGFAFFSHFVIEKNRPATFRHPLWSFRGDMRMWLKMATGTMNDEVKRVMELLDDNEGNGGNGADGKLAH